MSRTVPSRNDGVTIVCLVCGQHFAPSGRRQYCSDACRQAGHRRRHQDAAAAPPVTSTRSRREATVYECPECEARLLGEQYCHDCLTFARRLGPGGLSPCCGEAVLLAELGVGS